MKIELLLAHEDGTWTTKIFDCPDELDRNDLNAVEGWLVDEIYDLSRYRKVVLFAVYNSNPE